MLDARIRRLRWTAGGLIAAEASVQVVQPSESAQVARAPRPRTQRVQRPVCETKDGYVFKADVPGVKIEDLEITTTGNRLQISGKREHEQESKTDTAYTYERQYGSFTRSFTLPDGTDLGNAKSELKDGVLTLVIPKPPGVQPKKIAIGAGTPKS